MSLFNLVYAQDSLFLQTKDIAHIDSGHGIFLSENNLYYFGSAANWLFFDGYWQGFINKSDTLGNIINDYIIADTLGQSNLTCFAIGEDQNLIFAGLVGDYFHGDILLAFYKFDTYFFAKKLSISNTFTSVANSITVSPDNTFIIGGNINIPDEPDIPYNLRKILLLKIDKNGDIIWEKIIDEFLYDNKVISIVPLPNGNFLANCLVNWSAWDGVGQIAFIELTTNGDIVNKKIIPVQSYFEAIHSFKNAANNTFIGTYVDYVDGKYNAIIKLDQNYNVLWQSPDLCNDCGNGEVAELPSGDIIVAGCYLTGDSLEAQVHLTKLSPQGNIIWQRLYGGEKNDYAYALATDPNGTFWVTGRWESGLESIPLYNADSSVVMNGGTADILLLHTNCLGLLENPSIEMQQSIENYNATFTADTLGFRGEPYVLVWDFGDGSIAPAFAGGSVTHTYAQSGTYWATLNAYFCDTLSVGQCVQINTSETCPEDWVLGNEQMPPLHNNLPVSYVPQENALHFWTELQQAQLQIVDTQGRVILQNQCTGNRFSLPQQLPAGVYLYQIFDQHRQNKLAYGKFFVH
ncbi:MAG: PKD domain-containing protein [Chitinophagales bacterium]